MYKYKSIITRQKIERRDDCDGCDDDFDSRGCKLTVTIVTTVTDRNDHKKSIKKKGRNGK